MATLMGGGSLGGGLSPTVNKLVALLTHAHLANIRNLSWKIKSKKLSLLEKIFLFLWKCVGLRYIDF